MFREYPSPSASGRRGKKWGVFCPNCHASLPLHFYLPDNQSLAKPAFPEAAVSTCRKSPVKFQEMAFRFPRLKTTCWFRNFNVLRLRFQHVVFLLGLRGGERGLLSHACFPSVYGCCFWYVLFAEKFWLSQTFFVLLPRISHEGIESNW